MRSPSRSGPTGDPAGTQVGGPDRTLDTSLTLNWLDYAKIQELAAELGLSVDEVVRGAVEAALNNVDERSLLDRLERARDARSDA